MESRPPVRFTLGRQSSMAPDRCFGSDSESEEVDGLDAIDPRVRLMFFSSEGDLEGIKELLDSGTDVNFKDIDNRTALHVAACQGFCDVAELLLKGGAEVDPKDRWGSTPLADAIHYKNHDMIKLLERHGAKPLMAPMHVKNARQVPEYEIDAKELDFTDSVDITKGTFTMASWRGTQVAVKKLGDELFTDEDKVRAFRDELELLQKIRHPNVVCRDPRWGCCFESFSEDPAIVRAMTEIIPGLQGDIPSNSHKGVPFVARQEKVAACAKHFVGDGGTTRGINENNTVINQHGLMSIHMPPYYDSIRKGVSTIMISYSSWNGVKMHRNRELITGFLKNTLKFRGFVISDFKGIDKMTTPPHVNYTWLIQESIGAGIDMVMVGYNYTEFIDGLTYLVKNDFIPMSRIDDAVRRILRVKFVMGLFENPLTDITMAEHLGKQHHRELAREAVRKSLVLLKNGKCVDQPMLPLPKKSTRILIAGSHADDIGNQCGGWTIEWHRQI